MRTIALSLVLISLLVAPAAFSFQSKDDDRIHDQVMQKLAADADVKGPFDIDVKDGVVTIKGVVEKEKSKERATHLAKKVKGVKSVDNQIVVKPRSS